MLSFMTLPRGCSIMMYDTTISFSHYLKSTSKMDREQVFDFALMQYYVISQNEIQVKMFVF